MIEVLSKPLDEIGKAEIQSLVHSKISEGDQVEFKGELPSKKGKPDSWASKNEIGDYARNQILEEVVAFANAYGGGLLVGIEESRTRPPVATGIRPVPQCTELAERLRSMFLNCVEPQLVRLDIMGVPTEADGSGVVIIRVGKSRLAPHRVTTTLVCPVRRADRCQKMTMREIQDMALNVSRGLERLEKRLSQRSERFREEFERLERHENAFGIRLTAVPVVDEIQRERVFQSGGIVEELDIPWSPVVIQGNSNSKQNLEAPPRFPPLFWRPLVRGARGETVAPPSFQLSYLGYREIYCDGLVEFGLVETALFARCEWFFAMFANLAVWADHVRKEVPAVEYAIEVEVHNLGDAGFPIERGRLFPGIDLTSSNVNHCQLFKSNPEYFKSKLRLENLKFPRYPLHDFEETPYLLSQFYRDFYHSMHKDIDAVDFVLA